MPTSAMAARNDSSASRMSGRRCKSVDGSPTPLFSGMAASSESARSTTEGYPPASNEISFSFCVISVSRSGIMAADRANSTFAC